MKLHMVDVLGQYEKIQNDIDEAVLRVVKSGQYILGPEVREFERQIAEYLGCKHAIGCASGTDALQIALMASDIGPGNEVITTPFTFVATAETIALLGAKPVYVDIREEDFNIDPGLIEDAITANTKAIIPVHLYGQPAEMDAIMNIARKHNLSVIEDSAQSMGAEYKGKKVGTIGSFGCISFFPSKNLGAYGDAGMIVTDDDALAEKARIIAIHGSKVRYKHSHIGINSRLDTIQAAILSVKLPYLDMWNQKRYEAAKRYDDLLSGLPVKTPGVLPDRTHIFHQYTIRVPKRDALAEYLTSKKIPYGVYYPIPLHLQEAYRYLGYKKGDFPVTEKLTNEVISLPMHSELNTEQQEYIVRAIREFFV
jgi:UDP-2-acetamido-2-deoxy-ribo-hexuluronate aminotransferase